MRNFACLVALAAMATVAAGTTTACSSNVDDDDTASGAGSAATIAPAGPTPIAGSSLRLPVPGSTGNKISAADKATIIKAWLDAKRDYYDAPKGYIGATGQPIAAPAYSEVAGVPCGGSFSTLVCRFYAHMPSYASVIPNYRGCFSYMANGGLQVPTSLWDPTATTEATTMRAGTYAEAFDHCLYQDYDKVMNHVPAWSTAEVAKNKAAHNEIGVVKYMSADLRAAFKFIMYTWYEPATYDAADQTEILQKVYGSFTPPATPPPVGSGTRHAQFTTIVDSMNAYIAANKQW